MSENFDSAKDLIQWNKRLLSISGIWPLDYAPIKFYSWLFYCVIHFFLGCSDLIRVFGDIDLMGDSFVETVAKFMIIMKMLVLRYSELLRRVVMDVEIGAEKDYYKNAKERSIYMHYNSIGAKFVKTITCITFTTSWLYYLKALVLYLRNVETLRREINNYVRIDILYRELRNETTEFILPYRIYTFFNITDYRTYMLVYLYNCPMIYVYTSQIVIACFMWSLVLHVCSQLSVLAYRIKNINVGNSDELQIPELEFRDIVQKHLKIIGISQAIDDIFNLILLAELATSTVGLVFSTYSALSNSDLKDVVTFLSFLLFATAMLAEVYGYCVAGDYLMRESMKVHDAYFECEWYNMPPQYRKHMTICMARAQSPLQLTGGGFYIFSLNGFTSVIKTAMGYVSMLRQLTLGAK